MKKDLLCRPELLAPAGSPRRGRRLRELVVGRWIRQLPDRKYLENLIFPWLLDRNPRRLLFVGCQCYTQDYHRRFEGDHRECWTLDIVPESAVWGADERHIVGDVLRADELFERRSFDAVIFNGVFGYGINTVAGMNRSLSALHAILKPRGLLVLGWNTHRAPDPLDLSSLRPAYEPLADGSLPPRVSFPGSTHVYDFYLAASD
jgi:SAM-dependent methyltransferase